MKSIIQYTILILLMLGIIQSSVFAKDPKIPTFQETDPIKLVQDMAPGWNLGNTLEAVPNEGSWNNPPVQPETFDDIKSYGFKSIRIPINFYNHIGKEPDFKIDPQYLDRLEQVFDQALDRKFYAILDFHDFYQIFGNMNSQDTEFKLNRFDKVWAQIADRFKNKNEKLLFEIVNEPDGSSQQINDINLRILNIIRKSGGFNDKRLVLLPSRNTDTQKIKEMVIPNDKNIVITCHWYTPWWFVSGSQLTWGSTEERNYTDRELKNLHDTFVAKGIPVIIGEFGGGDNAQKYYDWVYADYLNRAAQKNGITTMIWDNGGGFDRKHHTWNDPVLPQIIISAVSGKTSSFLKRSEVFLKVGEKPEDISIEFDPNGNLLLDLFLETKPLVKDRDYTVDSTQLILKSNFLKGLVTSNKPGLLATLTVHFSSGADNEIRIHQYDTPVADIKEINITKGDQKDVSFGVKVNGNWKQVCVRAVKSDGSPLKELGMLNFGDISLDSWNNPDAVSKITLSGKWVMSKFTDGGTISVEYASGEKIVLPIKMKN